MADFQTHVQTSSGLGAVYAVGGALMGYPTDACLLAGGLCGLSGMLPDLDSDTGVPFRETTAFVAAISPMLMIDRWVSMGFSVESMVLSGAGIYLGIRFGLFKLLQWYTIHRGMFHSLPAMVIVGQIAFLLCTCHSLETRYFKAAGMMLGYLSHLVLDEIYSVDFYNLRIKKSFGTAVKFFGPQLGPNLFSYGILGFLGLLMNQDPLFQLQWHLHRRGVSAFAMAQDAMLAPHASYSRNLYSPTYFQDEPPAGPLAPIRGTTEETYWRNPSGQAEPNYSPGNGNPFPPTNSYPTDSRSQGPPNSWGDARYYGEPHYSPSQPFNSPGRPFEPARQLETDPGALIPREQPRVSTPFGSESDSLSEASQSELFPLNR